MPHNLSLFVLFLFLFAFSGCFGFGVAKFPTGEKVALVEVKGMIADADEVIEDLEKARKNQDVKAIVVRVDSPGGSVAASQEIFRTIKNLNNEKPVVVSMGDVAASGGYYVSAAARKIFANEGTVTGSIGIRMEHINAKGLFDLIRLEPETLKSGRYKDIGSAYRQITPEERDILEGFLAELHSQFKKDIAENRNLRADFVDQIADGRVYTGLRAKELGLIDEIGGYVEAVKDAAKMAGIKGEPHVAKMRKERPWWYEFFTENSKALLDRIRGGITGYKYFLYEWRPY